MRGIVYYPRFMHYFHLAFEEFFANEMGIDYAEVLYKRNLSLPTVHLESDFRRRLRYGDQINMEVKVINETRYPAEYLDLEDPNAQAIISNMNLTKEQAKKMAEEFIDVVSITVNATKSFLPIKHRNS
jgi:hypothetical protein